MGASKKLSLTGDDDLFNDLANFSNPVTSKTPTEKKIEKKPVAKKSIILRITEDFERELKSYCTKYDMTVTAAIKKAVREMLQKDKE